MSKTLYSAFHSSEITMERSRRWRLILGPQDEQQSSEESQAGSEEEGQNAAAEGSAGEGTEGQSLSEKDQALEEMLEALYGSGSGQAGGTANSQPDIARHLARIHDYFPDTIAEFVQQDSLKKINLRRLLKEPDLLEKLEPNLNLVARLMALQKTMPEATKNSARKVVREVVEQLIEKLEYPLLQAIHGSIKRNLRARNPRKLKEVNWLQTIKVNLKHYQPQQGTVIPETLVSYGRQNSSLHDVILCLDQSGSMAKSVVYGSIFASVMASVPAISTKLVLFDTQVVDVTEQLRDPVELLFGLRLRGGTHIAKALKYCQGLVTQASDTVLVLISDLFESGDKQAMLKVSAQLVADGVKVVVLLALNDDGAPRFNRQLAEELASLDIPAFACTPDLFPELMGAILSRQDIAQWTALQGIVKAPLN